MSPVLLFYFESTWLLLYCEWPQYLFSEPVVGIVPPSAAVTQQSQQTFGSATPSSSSGVTPSAAVSSDFSASQYSQPSTSSFSSSQATTLLPTNIVTSQVVQSVSPQTVVSTQPTQQSTAGTEVVSQQSAPIALVVSSQQSTAAPPLVISQVISVAGTPAVTSQANVGATATVIAVQGSDEQPSGSTHATSSTTGEHNFTYSIADRLLVILNCQIQCTPIITSSMVPGHFGY